MSTKQHPSAVPHFEHEHEVVPVDDDCWEIVELVSRQRALSYLEGQTTDILLNSSIDERKNKDATDTFRTGVAGEVAASLALDMNVLEGLDLEVSDEGDDGWDLELNDGRQTVDVKGYWGQPTGSPPQLVVEYQKVLEAKSDAYLLAQVWDSNYAVLHGWCTRRQLMDWGRVERPPRWDQVNWVLSADELRPISELREWVDGTPF